MTLVLGDYPEGAVAGGTPCDDPAGLARQATDDNTRMDNPGLTRMLARPHWRSDVFAQVLGELFPVPQAPEPYQAEFGQAMLAALRAKLGLVAQREEDRALADDLLRLMANDRADFTITFCRLAHFSTQSGGFAPPAAPAARDLFMDREAFDAWAVRYRQRLQAEANHDTGRAGRMNRANPKYVLRNHLAETAIEHARNGDFAEVARLLKVLQHPLDEQPLNEADAAFPPDWAAQLEVSCSS